MELKNIVVISDLHIGCQLGLCPDKVKLDDGGGYTSSKLQKAVWRKWKEFWDEWVPMVTRGEPFILVINGDTLDGVHHNSTTQISHNLTDQKKVAYQVLAPIVMNPICKGLYVIRGTEAHVGKSGADEEELAKALGAIPNQGGQYARWELWMEFGKLKQLVHFTHHVGTTSSAAYESTAVYKELVEAFNEAGRWKLKPPTIVVRSHRHRFFKCEIPSINGDSIAIVTPGWQLKTPFTYRMALGRSGTPQIGGIIIRDGDEDGIYTRSKTWHIERTNTERV